MAKGHAHKQHQHDQGSPRSGVSVGILTCSDRGARGERADVAGPTIHNLVLDRISGAKVVHYKVVPDDREQITSTLMAWADEEQLDLILTTGGTGLSPRDVTPDATHAVIDRSVPAFAMAMLFESLRVTPYAMLTRAAAGIRDQTLIINLPGNPKAIQENLDAIIEVLPHAVQIVRGEDTHADGSRQAGHIGHNDGQDDPRTEHGHSGGHVSNHGPAPGAVLGHEKEAVGSHQGDDSIASMPEESRIARGVGGPPC